jgi:hypothetical protein
MFAPEVRHLEPSLAALRRASSRPPARPRRLRPGSSGQARPIRADHLGCAASTQPKETEMAKDKKAKKDKKPVKKGK